MIKKFFSSFFLATIVLVCLMTFRFLSVLFSARDPGKYFAYFQTMFFENKLNPDQSLTLRLGFTGEVLPIILSLMVMTIIAFLFLSFYSFLKKRREFLLSNRKK